jgi:hypothetical protein
MRLFVYTYRHKRCAKCLVCNEDYFEFCDEPGRPSIYTHLITEHPDKCYKCKMCDKLFIRKYDLDKHKKEKVHSKSDKTTNKINSTVINAI